MKAFSKLIIAGCLACAAPLVQACEPGKQCGHAGMMIHEMDKNGDGAISKKEFDAFHNAHFREVDANKDGKITQDEMDAMHQKMMGHAKDRFINRFEESDINHDGALSKDEAEIGMPMLFAHFDEIDADKDGKVTKEEFTESMKKMRENRHEKHGEGMMKHDHK